MEDKDVFDMLITDLKERGGCETLETIYRELDERSKPKRCDCRMSHDITFCINHSCAIKNDCMRYEKNHIMISYYSCAIFDIDKEVGKCIYFIGRER